jgi:hypothetical protein
MTEKDQGADLRPILPTTRAIIERAIGRAIGRDLWRHASYVDGMLRAAEREQAFHEAANGRCPPVATAPVEPVEDRTDQAA